MAPAQSKSATPAMYEVSPQATSLTLPVGPPVMLSLAQATRFHRLSNDVLLLGHVVARFTKFQQPRPHTPLLKIRNGPPGIALLSQLS